MNIFKNKDKRLRKYAKAGDIKGVRKMIGKGANVNWKKRKSNFTSSLAVAVQKGHLEVTRVLLEHGADPNGRDGLNRTPLHYAISMGHVEIAKLLLENRADVNAKNVAKGSLLSDAISCGNTAIAKVLIESGANVNNQDVDGLTPLHFAAADSNIEITRLLLENGSDVSVANRVHQTALHQAASRMNVELVRLLVENGADVHVFDMECKSPLHYAIYASANDVSKGKVVAYLLSHGASMTSQDDAGETFLCEAIRSQCLPVVNALLQHGADPNAKDNSGKTAMDYAIESTNAKKLKPLVKPFTSTIKAMESENREALRGFLRQSIVRASVDDMIVSYNELEYGVYFQKKPEWKRALGCAMHDHKLDMLYFAFETDNTGKRDAIFTWINNTAWIQRAGFSDSSTLMQRAVIFQNLNALDRMICFEIEPYETSNDCLLVSEAADSEKLKEKTRDQIMETMKLQYTENARLLFQSSEISISDRIKLIQSTLFFSTCMHELVLIMNFATEHLEAAALKSMCQMALDMAIRRSFVYEDKDRRLFIKIILELRKRSLLLEEEKDDLLAEAIKVNAENSIWVRRMKASIQRLDERLTGTSRGLQVLQDSFNGLVAALQAKEREEVKRAKIRLAVSLTCTSLSLFGGSAVKEVLESVVFMSNPGLVLNAITDTSIGTDNGVVVKARVKSVLEEASIASNDFVTKLQEAMSRLSDTSSNDPSTETSEKIDLFNNHSSITYRDKDDFDKLKIIPTRRLTIDGQKAYQNKAKPNDTINQVSLVDVVRMLVRQQRNKKEEFQDGRANSESSVRPAVSVKPTFVDLSKISMKELRTHPLHYAVYTSAGDKEQFVEYAESILSDGLSINETMSLHVREDHLSGDWEDIECSAVMFASYMGYVKIVKWLLLQNGLQIIEPGFTTRSRAEDAAKICQAAQAICDAKDTKTKD